jgi:hypothetical protein
VIVGGPTIVRPLVPGRTGRLWLTMLLGGVAGIAATLAVYAELSARLPAEIPDHFSLTGQVNGSLPPGEFVEVGVVLVAGLTILFTAILYGVSRSAVLERIHGARLAYGILALGLVFCAGVQPTAWSLLLASAAGVLPLSGGTLDAIVVAADALPVLLLVAILLALRATSHTGPVGGPGTPTPSLLGPVELLCSSCGERFRLDRFPLLAPHMGMGTSASLYLKCPRCGERGWNTLLRPPG